MSREILFPWKSIMDTNIGIYGMFNRIVYIFLNFVIYDYLRNIYYNGFK